MPNLYDTKLPAQDVYVGDVKIAGKDAALFQKGAAITATATQINEVAAASLAAVQKYKSAPITRVANTNANDTSIVVPKRSIIKNVWVDVATAEATGTTKTVDVGIKGGAADAFLNGVSVASKATVKGTLASTGQTLGAALTADESGSGALVPEPYVCNAATTITYSLGSADFAELDAYIIVEYVELA
jgi:hypothetical protein